MLYWFKPNLKFAKWILRPKDKATGKKTEEKYSDKLLHEVKEAKEDFKTWKYFKGTANEVIKNLHEEMK